MQDTYRNLKKSVTMQVTSVQKRKLNRSKQTCIYSSNVLIISANDKKVHIHTIIILQYNKKQYVNYIVSIFYQLTTTNINNYIQYYILCDIQQYVNEHNARLFRNFTKIPKYTLESINN